MLDLILKYSSNLH